MFVLKVGIKIPTICKLIAIIIIFTLPYLCANLIQIIEDGIPASPTKSHDKPATLSKPSIDFKIVGKNVPCITNPTPSVKYATISTTTNGEKSALLKGCFSFFWLISLSKDKIYKG